MIYLEYSSKDEISGEVNYPIVKTKGSTLMKISDRFLDYGLTGGFFWTVQIILLLIFYPTAWHSMATIAIGAIPQQLAGSANAIFGALGIIAIFFTGALLDLFSPLYALPEMFTIRKHLISNKDWLKDEVIKYPSPKYDLEKMCIFQDDAIDNHNDIEWMCSVVNGPPKIKHQNSYLVFIRTYPRLYLKYKFLSLTEKRELVQHCQNFIAFFNSYLLKRSDASQLESLMDQMHLWSTMRAFSSAISLLSLELLVLLAVKVISPPLPDLRSQIGIALAVSLILIIFFHQKLADYIISKSFSRLCTTMLSLVYLTTIQESEEKPSSSQQMSPSAQEVNQGNVVKEMVG